MARRPNSDPLSNSARLVAALLALCPLALGGAVLRSRAGPGRDAWTRYLDSLLPVEMPRRRLPPQIADDRLLGGLDLAATLRAGKPMVQRGLLAESDGGLLTLPMAERMEPALAGKMAAAMDAGEVVLERDGLSGRLATRFALLLLDEGLEADETPPAGLLDRLAFHLQLDDRQEGDDDAPIPGFAAERLAKLARRDIAAAQKRLPAITTDDRIVESLCATAQALAIASARPLRFALTAAQAAAALNGHEAVSQEDAALAAGLVLAPRAMRLPADPQPDRANETPPQPDENARGQPADPDAAAEAESVATPETPENVVLAAAKAAIPPDLLASLEGAVQRDRKEGGAGRANKLQAPARRGRPTGARPGPPKPGQRLNVLATLRAAAPWQRIRRAERLPEDGGRSPPLLLRREDFRITRYKHHPETTTVFAVDASGSTALHRLAEAKGAIELLLADCYIRRDSVALLTFSGSGAELLLPPTRSLTRVKRCLAGFPAGGGTPLAAAITAANDLAEALTRKGQAATVVFLTDGRGNVAMDGTADRERAAKDAEIAARRLAANRFASLLVDISPRPRPAGQRLAQDLGARYLALPQADAVTLSAAVRQQVPGSVT